MTEAADETVGAAVDPLRGVSLFADLDDGDLARLRGSCPEIQLARGELLFTEGDPGDAAYVLASGEIEVFKTTAGREVLLAAGGGSRLIGEMALLLDEPRNASVRARTPATLIRLSQEQLQAVLTSSPSAAMAMLDVMIERLRSTQSKLKQDDRMVQLGTLTAGLAHELNNPAAAVERGAEHLARAFTAAADAQRIALSAGVDLTDDRAAESLAAVRTAARARRDLSALDRLDREQSLTSWLEEHHIDESWLLAPALAGAGIEPAQLDAIADVYEADAAAALLRLLAAEYEVASLLHQIAEGASRMSAIVKALKSYAYLDQAPQQEIRVTDGLEDTLLILSHKLGSITVERAYEDDLPPIMAYGSELNQVWTNLLDNAAYAITEAGLESGRIIVRVHATDETMVVEVEDNGPGIPADIQDRIFDSFFTTKPVGAGTGLGLDITYGIVVNRHRGSLSFTSEPGRTCFRVELPIQAE